VIHDLAPTVIPALTYAKYYCINIVLYKQMQLSVGFKKKIISKFQ